MKTVETVFHQMIDTKTVMPDLRDTLREIDPNFKEAECRYLEAAAELERTLGDGISPSVGEYLAARENALAMELIYIGWQGFQLSLDIFKDPVNALLLKEDYEDLHCEHRLGTLPATKKAWEVQVAFHAAVKDMPENTKHLAEDVDEFYSYLETVGYKVAHYFGFRLADRFLSCVEPGYTGDHISALRYLGDLKDYLQIDLDRVG